MARSQVSFLFVSGLVAWATGPIPLFILVIQNHNHQHKLWNRPGRKMISLKLFKLIASRLRFNSVILMQ